MAIMFQGTGSDVGKTVLVAGVCRALKKRDFKVIPFKPQNMSNNAAVANDGGEIGRAQWLQALACGVEPSIHMNPVLLKPQSETGSQIVVHGQVAGVVRGRDYQTLKPKLLDAVLSSFTRLKSDADIVVVEGAGSPAEINLRAGDIANMGFATKADVPVILVGDIDRGGVIASLVGTHCILPEKDRAMISGFIINKFRGDISLFDNGLAEIFRFTPWRNFGVVPWLEQVSKLPAEDSVALGHWMMPEGRGLKIVVPVLDRISNFDDLDPLGLEESVDLHMLKPGGVLPKDTDVIILPGSKSTIADLNKMRTYGWDKQIIAHARCGGLIIGVCGGYQMLGKKIIDPDGLEGEACEVEGLGLLDVETIIRTEKQVRNVSAFSPQFKVPFSGYEIHMGETNGPDCARPTSIINGQADGAISPDGCIWGTYLHGFFDNGSLRKAWLSSLGFESYGENHLEKVSHTLDEIADQLESVLDINAIIQVAKQHAHGTD